MFVGIRLPEEVVDMLDRFVEPRRDVDSTLRWSRREQWHITLAFMPDVSDHALDGLLERLRVTAAAAKRFELSLAGAGAFPNAFKAKVLWTGVAGGVDELTHLAGNVRSACARSGAEVEGGEYRPHLTLARLNRPIDVTRWLRIFELFESETWPVGSITLFQSHLGHGPARHQIIEEFPIGASPES